MHTSNGDVKSIGLGLGRNAAAFNQLGRKRTHLRIYRQSRNAAQSL